LAARWRKGVSFALNAGEILALLGENGAGKSTLIKIFAGVYAADSGGVLYRGEPYRHAPPKSGTVQRVAFIHQDLGLLESMTVAENIAMSVGFPRRCGLIAWSEAETIAQRALDKIGTEIDPTRRVQSLRRTEKPLVAIARALAVEADVLVLDEPTASLPADDVVRLFTALKRSRDQGIGMIFVSHRLDEVFDGDQRVRFAVADVKDAAVRAQQQALGLFARRDRQRGDQGVRGGDPRHRAAGKIAARRQLCRSQHFDRRSGHACRNRPSRT
jgi:ribose transport system ATP-binding protein